MEEKEMKVVVVMGDGVSGKTGKPYNYVDITFPNSYQRRLFLNAVEKVVFENLFTPEKTLDFSKK